MQVCENGHAFDIARQGYINLLPVQQKRSKQPGDSKEMVLARAQFLNSGVYGSIASTLAQTVLAQTTGEREICLMDSGCGEGYYLDTLFDQLKIKGGRGDVSFIGLDISKAAIAEAAKRNKQITWIVGTNKQPPVAVASVGIILCVFGFHNFKGFHKVLEVGGKLIVVEPGPDHLQELREIIYSEVKRSEPQNLSYAEDIGYSIQDEQLLKFKTGDINKSQINNLLVMTPHFYKASREGRAAASRLQKLNLTVDVVIRTLEKI